MSKFICKCGNIISDVEYPTPGSGVLLSEKALDTLLGQIGEILSDLRNAEKEGRRSDWINKLFSDGYPEDATDSEIVEDLLSQQVNVSSRSTTECGRCGRLYVQSEPGSATYNSFLREDTE
jgi:hypothetical protein